MMARQPSATIQQAIGEPMSIARGPTAQSQRYSQRSGAESRKPADRGDHDHLDVARLACRRPTEPTYCASPYALQPSVCRPQNRRLRFPRRRSTFIATTYSRFTGARNGPSRPEHGWSQESGVMPP